MTQNHSRRLAAIVAADVAEYSRLMEDDEEGTIRTLQECRQEIVDPLLAEYNGRLANTAGDSLLLEFQSAVDAVRCVLSLQDTMAKRNENIPDDRRFEFRIGVNVGDVVSQGVDLLGNGVNVAARLEAQADPGGILISRSVLEQIDGRVRVAVDEVGRVQVKNISRPVQVYRLRSDGLSRIEGPPGKVDKRGIFFRAAAVAVMIVLGIYGTYELLRPDFEPAVAEEMAHPLPDRPSILVLPFTNLSNDPDQEIFADGITEDLITDLSKISGLFVIGRNTSFSFKASKPSIKQVAETTGVRYILTGSVRRSGEMVRLNAQLLDALNGQSVWAERTDGAISNVFATQDAFAFKVVEALQVELSTSETESLRTRDTNLLDARNSFQKGWELYSRFNEADNLAAITHFRRAIELDPNYGRAYGAMTIAQLRPFIFHHWAGHYSQGRNLRFDIVASSLKAALEHGTSLAYVGQTILFLNYPAGRGSGNDTANEALVAAGRAIAVQPNDPEAHITMAWALLFAGRPAEALKFIDSAMRLDPHYPSHYALFKAAAHYAMGDLTSAAQAINSGLDRDPHAVELMPVAASILAQLGQRADARSIIDVWMPDADRATLEAAAEKYFFIVRWEGDDARLNRQLQDGLKRAILPRDLTVESLIDVLDQTDIRQRVRAVRYLGLLGAEAATAVPALIDVLSSESRLLQKEAIIAIGKIGPDAKAAIPALTVMVDAPLIGFHAKKALDSIRRE